jgi:uncharacterized protein with NRDE domain
MPGRHETFRMCTLIALHRCIPGAPLVIAANRDEFFERPAEGPVIWETAEGRVVAPRDVRAGGTWLGVNAYGVVAAVTNRRCPAPDPSRRSRGLLVMDALRAGSASDAAEVLEELPIDAYNPFNLLVADEDTAHAFSYEGKVQRIDLEPGVHVIGNVHPLERPAKLERIRAAALRAGAGSPSQVLDSLAEICREHDGEGALDSACVHAGPYGTRSSILMRVGGDSSGELRFADGAPCQHSYRDFTALLGELDSVRAGEQTNVRKIR